MFRHIVLAAVAAAIALATGSYALGALDHKSFAIAEASSDACYGRNGVGIGETRSTADSVGAACERPLRDYETDWIWRCLAAAAIGAIFAVLIVGGFVIVQRRRRFRPDGLD
jgi:uncharacterized membrane protein